MSHRRARPLFYDSLDGLFWPKTTPPSPPYQSHHTCFKMVNSTASPQVAENAMYPAFRHLQGKRVILASTSPRRIDLFTRMGLDFQVVPSNFEEDYDKARFPNQETYCAATCLRKGEIVLQNTRNDSTPPSLIVSSDTIVVGSDGEIYEKPIDRQDAVRMLSNLSGTTIKVITAATIIYRTGTDTFQTTSFTEITEMHMESYDLATIDAVIEGYIAKGEGLSYSGALSYQGSAFMLVKGITGCFYNLIGFPAPRFYQEITTIINKIL